MHSADYVERPTRQTPTAQGNPLIRKPVVNITMGGTYNRLCGSPHNRFGGRARETDRRKGRHRALVRPYDEAVVVCIDEKTQVQALDRTAPILPMRPGLPEKATHDYVRHGTTSLFAALEVATGKVTDACYQRHTHVEFLEFSFPCSQVHLRTTDHGNGSAPSLSAKSSAICCIVCQRTPGWLLM
jgi:hypothetical protein